MVASSFTLQPSILGATRPASSQEQLFTARTPGQVDRCLSRGAVLDATTSDGCSALHLALLARRPKVVLALLAAGADASVGRSTLRLAVLMGLERFVPALLAAGASPIARNGKGQTALHAVFSRRLRFYTPTRATVEALLAAGARWESPDDRGVSPSDLAERWAGWWPGRNAWLATFRGPGWRPLPA